MKALSIRQPWAWLVAMASGYSDPKRVENRQWWTNYRGPLLIHAARQFDLAGAQRVVARRPDLKGIEDPNTWAEPGMRGGIVGIANLVDVAVPTADPWYDRNVRYGWILEHAYPVPFFPLPGMPGLFDVPDDSIPPESRAGIDLWLATVQGRH